MRSVRLLPALMMIAIVSRQLQSQGVPSYLQQIVAQNAPIIIEETTDNGEPNQRRVNHLLRIDFDGDLNGGNNDDHAIAQYYPLATPTVYYSVVETDDAYFIGYYFYHNRDNGTRAGPNNGGHQHDLEGIWSIVEKSPYYPFGFSRLALSQAHGAMLPYYDPDWFSQPPTIGIPGEFQHSPIGQIHHWTDPNNVSRPVVAVRRNTHGTYLAQQCDQPNESYGDFYGMMRNRAPTDPFLACIHSDADGIVYVPAPYGCAPSAGCNVDPVPMGASHGSYYYTLTSLFDDQAFWPTRQTQGLMFGGDNLMYLGGNQWAYLGFHGTDGDNEANPPWAWYGGAGVCFEEFTVVGCWYSFGVDDTDSWYDRIFWPQFGIGNLLDNPTYVAHEYFAWRQWSTNAIYNPFVGGAGSHPPDMSVTIDGPTTFNDDMPSGTWNAVVTGGTPPYTYQWTGVVSGTESTISGTVNENSMLYLDVWDATGVHIALSLSLIRCPGHEEDCW